MAEDTANAAPDASSESNSETTTFTQQQVNDLIAREKGKIQAKYEGHEDLKAKAARLDELEAANATEVEKANKKVTTEKERADAAEAKLLRFEVAAEKEVPADYLDLLVGNTRDELEAKAEKIVQLVKSRNESNDPPDFNGGAREPAPDTQTPDQAHNALILGLAGITPDP